MFTHIQGAACSVFSFDGRNQDIQVIMRFLISLRTHAKFKNEPCKVQITIRTAIYYSLKQSLLCVE